ncbi:hypothetical protein HS088_TW06G00613 [Tripterygium wilfordii]|uniref:Uncharacterized protein n=1 Tax=Tripterygium wilfordii TaxID=458696 RepID=A0A7J7DJA7_TRIWF|nr:hypothetical protein HS088_TW06G00613 [Tripterygium wilfordii]
MGMDKFYDAIYKFQYYKHHAPISSSSSKPNVMDDQDQDQGEATKTTVDLEFKERAMKAWTAEMAPSYPADRFSEKIRLKVWMT